MMMTVKEQLRFLQAFQDMDARISRGQAPTLEDRELIHRALVIMKAVLTADDTERDGTPQLPGQMSIYDYPEAMPQQSTERRGKYNMGSYIKEDLL